MKNLLFLAWRNLFRNPRRTLASLLTVGLGSGGLLIYQGFNTGIMNQYRENTIRGYYGYGQVFPKEYYGQVREKPWEVWIENWTQVDQSLKSVPHVLDSFPRISFHAFLVKGGVNLSGQGQGILPERENSFFTEMNFIEGRNLESENEVILGKGLAHSLNAKPGDTLTVLSQTVYGQLNGVDVQVAGIFHMGQKSIDDTFFRVHLNTAQSLLDTDKVESFSLSTQGVQFWDPIEKSILEKNPQLEPIRFEILDKVYYQNSADFLAAQFAFIRSIILIIVALGIFNTITVGLLERSGEVGALRANGESRSRLLKVLCAENALIGLLGGLLGIIIAVVIDKTLLTKGIPMPPGPGITRQYMIFLEMQPEHFAQALILPAVAAVVSGLFPIRKLLKKSIPELLRST